jgi:mannose-1-phosphate guanylyltransferase
MVKQGLPFYGYSSDAYWIDIGIPDDYLKLHHDILMGKTIANITGKLISRDVWIEPNCNIHPSAKLTGPVIIGKCCNIGQEVHITGPTVIGAGCTIGRGTSIEEAILWQNVNLDADITVRNSVIGNECIIKDCTRITDKSIISDNNCIGSSNSLEHGIRIWPGNIIENNAISF